MSWVFVYWDDYVPAAEPSGSQNDLDNSK